MQMKVGFSRPQLRNWDQQIWKLEMIKVPKGTGRYILYIASLSTLWISGNNTFYIQEHCAILYQGCQKVAIF